ncbi:MAG: PIG-L deacetylase family protein [Anaerovoracaceae bacterium]
MNILVVSPHMDDETLGAGGTLLKHKARGDKIFWLNIANVKTDYGYPDDVVSERDNQFKKVAQSFDFAEVKDLKLKPTALESYDKNFLIGAIATFIDKWKPEMLIIPFSSDIHSDHRVVYESMLPFTKAFRYPYIKKVISMEILSETEFAVLDHFHPNYFVDISDYLEKKKNLLSIYTGEIPDKNFPRSLEMVEVLAKFRGSIAGVDYAEAFEIIKDVY